MTTKANLSAAFVQLFDSEVHQAYQGSAQLQNVCRMRTGVVGNTVNFPKIGKGQACLLYTSPSPRDGLLSRMPSSA